MPAGPADGPAGSPPGGQNVHPTPAADATPRASRRTTLSRPGPGPRSPPVGAKSLWRSAQRRAVPRPVLRTGASCCGTTTSSWLARESRVSCRTQGDVTPDAWRVKGRGSRPRVRPRGGQRRGPWLGRGRRARVARVGPLQPDHRKTLHCSIAQSEHHSRAPMPSASTAPTRVRSRTTVRSDPSRSGRQGVGGHDRRRCRARLPLRRRQCRRTPVPRYSSCRALCDAG